jgi:hypothetical protein
MNKSLFIKRAEEYQTKEFIINVFHKKNIGKVNDVTFIKKQNNVGKSYNGVIVTFEKWYIRDLIDEINSSQNGTVKFNFNNSYWFINVHKEPEKEPEKEPLTDIDINSLLDCSTLSDKERIKQLEDLVKSMSSKINYMQTRQERSERNMMDYEHKDTQHHLNNIELHAKLEDKDVEQTWIAADFKEDIETLTHENELLRSHLERKYYECVGLHEELREKTCMLSYSEKQITEMKQLLRPDDDNHPIKEYIKQYC